jgi:hypothetical protein
MTETEKRVVVPDAIKSFATPLAPESARPAPVPIPAPQPASSSNGESKADS